MATAPAADKGDEADRPSGNAAAAAASRRVIHPAPAHHAAATDSHAARSVVRLAVQ